MKKSRLVIVGVVATALVALPVAYALGARRAGPSPIDLALINGVIQLVEQDYVHPVNPHDLTRDALKGMLTGLDPHSDYLDESEYQELISDSDGEFAGIGIEINREEHGCPVISPIDDTPAANAGLKAGDLIVGINGEPTDGMTLRDVVDVLRGDAGSAVRITIERGAEKPFDVSMTRAMIRVAR